jgi:hypothetical protein
VAETPTGDSEAKAEDARPPTNPPSDTAKNPASNPANSEANKQANNPNEDQNRRRQGRGGRDNRRGGNERGGNERGGNERGGGNRERGGNRGHDRGRRDGGRDRGGDRRSEQPLTAGLFAGVADREMPCRVAGCKNTWTWFGTQQIRSLGKPPPKRMCSEHLAEFEGIDDRQMPCRNTWCTHTWMWTRAAQLYQRERQEKLKPPHRLCDVCFEAERTTTDVEIPCKIPECKQTWIWDRHAQLRHRAWVGRQQAKADAEDAAELEADGHDAEPSEHAETPSDDVAPREGRRRRRRHRKGDAPAEPVEAAETVESAEPAEVSESAEVSEPVEVSEPAEVSEPTEVSEPAEVSEPTEVVEESAEPAVSGDHDHADHDHTDHDHVESGADEHNQPGKKRRRKRRRKRKIHDGPPEKLCERCFARLGHLEPIEVPCKVHGCTSTWTWDRDGQLRAWAALDAQENVTELPQPPRRMCNGCFEFVRHHSDREVACGRPDCTRTWTYKTGAQLQDFLAGRTQDPIRLCDECSRSQFTISSARGVELPEGSEVMPCQVSGCEGSWVYMPGMKLSSADPDAEEPPDDRMCDDCREQRGVGGRDPRRMASETPSEPEASAADQPSSEPDQPAGESDQPAGESGELDPRE